VRARNTKYIVWLGRVSACFLKRIILWARTSSYSCFFFFPFFLTFPFETVEAYIVFLLVAILLFLVGWSVGSASRQTDRHCYALIRPSPSFSLYSWAFVSLVSSGQRRRRRRHKWITNNQVHPFLSFILFFFSGSRPLDVARLVVTY